VIPTPPGTLIEFKGTSVNTYLVVKSPIADKLPRGVYVCGSWRGDPLPGCRVNLKVNINPRGDYILITGWALIDGRVLVGQVVVDPRTLPP
jgi:hypothetical protein